VPGLSAGDPRFREDDGSADPQLAAALAAFASGSGSEYAALTLLAGSRLLVPLVAALADQAAGAAGKLSEIALPTLVGRDSRPAVPAFTSLDALTRWQPAARPVPTDARLVWRAAWADSCAVVIDVAGPVPLAVEGARLAALAHGDAVPPPHQDGDVLDAVAEAVSQQPAIASAALHPGGAGADLAIRLTLSAAGESTAAAELAAELGSAVMARLGGRLRRGIAVAVGP
jgi:hypothetical protein